MSHTDLLTLRRLCRRHDDVRANAALLFAEICDAHTLSLGCIVGNPTFADRLGCTVKSIRNWLAELKEAGFITESRQGGKRQLVPTVPESCRNEFSETERSFRKDASETENSFRNGKDIRKEDSARDGKDFPGQRDNTPAEAREARACEEGEDLVRDEDPPAVRVFVETVGRRPYPDEAMEIPTLVGDTMRRLRIFREQCQKARRNVGDPSRVRWGYLAEDFERAVQRSDPGGDGMAVQPFEDNTGEGYQSFCPEYQINE